MTTPSNHDEPNVFARKGVDDEESLADRLARRRGSNPPVGSPKLPPSDQTATTIDEKESTNKGSGSRHGKGSKKGYVYKDYSHVRPTHEAIQAVVSASSNSVRNQKLPQKLNAMLTNPQFQHIVSFMPHGRAWKIHMLEDFVNQVVPRYFEYSNYNSFIRLVNAWGFRRITKGPDRNAYFHELFLKGMPHLHLKMRRLTVNEKKVPLDPDDEPDLYQINELFPLPPPMASALAAPSRPFPGLQSGIASSFLGDLQSTMGGAGSGVGLGSNLLGFGSDASRQLGFGMGSAGGHSGIDAMTNNRAPLAMAALQQQQESDLFALRRPGIQYSQPPRGMLGGVSQTQQSTMPGLGNATGPNDVFGQFMPVGTTFMPNPFGGAQLSGRSQHFSSPGPAARPLTNASQYGGVGSEDANSMSLRFSQLQQLQQQLHQQQLLLESTRGAAGGGLGGQSEAMSAFLNRSQQQQSLRRGAGERSNASPFGGTNNSTQNPPSYL